MHEVHCQRAWCQYRRWYQKLSPGNLPKHKKQAPALNRIYMVAHYFILWIPSVLPALAATERNLLCWHKLITGQSRQSISCSKLIAKTDRMRKVRCMQTTHNKKEREGREIIGWGKCRGKSRFAKFCKNFPFWKTNMPMGLFCIADPFSDSAVPDRISIINTLPSFSLYGFADSQKRKTKPMYQPQATKPFYYVFSFLLTIRDVDKQGLK